MDYQGKILKILQGKTDDFYLVGGTALARYYFHHRESEDLDFFTQEFNPLGVFEIVKEIEVGLKCRIVPIRELEGAKSYMIRSKGRDIQKIDFVQDFLRLKSKLNVINGIPVISLEDIYLRKIYAVAGCIEKINAKGEKVIEGGREEAKDFCDLYFLSHTSIPLSRFSAANCNQVVKEGLIRWFSEYDRKKMQNGLRKLKMKKHIGYQEMELYLKKEIDKLIKKEMSFI